jgi:hypothetical protein
VDVDLGWRGPPMEAHAMTSNAICPSPVPSFSGRRGVLRGRWRGRRGRLLRGGGRRRILRGSGGGVGPCSREAGKVLVVGRLKEKEGPSGGCRSRVVGALPTRNRRDGAAGVVLTPVRQRTLRPRVPVRAPGFFPEVIRCLLGTGVIMHVRRRAHALSVSVPCTSLSTEQFHETGY